MQLLLESYIKQTTAQPADHWARLIIVMVFGYKP